MIINPPTIRANEPMSEEVSDSVGEKYFYYQNWRYGHTFNQMCAILKHQREVCSCCLERIVWGAFVSHHLHSQEQFHPNLYKGPVTALLCRAFNVGLSGFENRVIRAQIKKYMNYEVDQYKAYPPASSLSKDT